VCYFLGGAPVLVKFADTCQDIFLTIFLPSSGPRITRMDAKVQPKKKSFALIRVIRGQTSLLLLLLLLLEIYES
jgi:hypothetical protein